MKVAKKKKKKWRFFWKNIGPLGVLNRLAAGSALLGFAYLNKEDKAISGIAALWGLAFLFDAVMKWSVWRAIFKWPSRHAYRKRYPEG